MTAFDFVTLAIALLGALLGLLNTWQVFDKKRVKIHVVPKHAIPVGRVDPRIKFCIEITNLSDFEITVVEVGVFFKGTTQRGAFIRPILLDSSGWPRRLAPRASVTVYGHSPENSEYPLKCVYATTACGVTKTGKSPAFEQMATQRIL